MSAAVCINGPGRGIVGNFERPLIVHHYAMQGRAYKVALDPSDDTPSNEEIEQLILSSGVTPDVAWEAGQ